MEQPVVYISSIGGSENIVKKVQLTVFDAVLKWFLSQKVTEILVYILFCVD